MSEPFRDQNPHMFWKYQFELNIHELFVSRRTVMTLLRSAIQLYLLAKPERVRPRQGKVEQRHASNMFYKRLTRLGGVGLCLLVTRSDLRHDTLFSKKKIGSLV